MKKTFLTVLTTVLLTVLFVQSGNAQVTVSGSNTKDGTYTSLTKAGGAFAALNLVSQVGYTITISITADVTTEDGTNALTGAAGMWTSLTITPSGNRTISGGVAMPLIDLSGADYVTINGVGLTGSNTLTISNTSVATTAGTSTIRLINGATNNTVKYCTIKGSEMVPNVNAPAAGSGVILFSTTTALLGGNNNNTIDHNNITCAADANRPLNAIYSLGTASYENVTNTISNNNIYDFLNKTAASNGIFLTSNTSAWTISDNNFYETALFTATTPNAAYVIINVLNSTGVNFTVSGNYIGGSAADHSGTWTKTGSYGTFNGISVTAGTASASNIQGNTVSKFNWSNEANTVWLGIFVSTGNFNIGTTSPNTIGAATGTGSIIVNQTSPSYSSPTYVFGIQTGGNIVNCNNNIIGSITATHSTIEKGAGITGIYINSTTTTTSNNTIGSTTTANSINATSISTLSDQYVIGIDRTANGGACTISGNTIANLSNGSTNSSLGILAGINYSGSTTASTVSGNFIRSLSATGSVTTASVYGIKIVTGTAITTYSNNIISIGGNTPSTIYGIYQNAASGGISKLYFNTVYIGGTLGSGLNQSYALYSASASGTRDFRNNIFYNARSTTGGSSLHYGMYIVTPGGTLTCDYNDYYVTGTGGVIGFYYTEDKTTLPIVPLTGADLNSKNVNPGFASVGGITPSDYTPSNLTLSGASGTGITVDYNNTARTYFSMGAFEYTVNSNITVTATSGTLNGHAMTLKDVFDGINAGIYKGDIAIKISGSTTETATAALYQSGYTGGGGTSSYTSVNIYPTVTGLSISGNLATPLIDLNGADNVTIDGRVNQTGNTDLTISNTNTSTTAGTSTIRFINDASINTVKYCTIKGSETVINTASAGSGTLFFSTGTSTGNITNTITYNTITSAGANLPFNAIYSYGTAAKENSGISITNNNIQDYSGASPNGIYLASNSSAWTITGNRFFQTATRDITGIQRDINIVTAGGGYVINNNIIGYSSALGTGTSTFTGTANLIPIELTVGTSTASEIHGNTITAISFSTSNTTNVGSGIFSGISVLAGTVNVGTTTANTIGAETGNDAITITPLTGTPFIQGIYATSTGTVGIQNNKIGGISVNGAATIGFTFFGINTAGTAGNITISGNTIGSTSTTNSIAVGTNGTTTTGVCSFYGIKQAATGTVSITGNTIQNCSAYGTGASIFWGIYNAGSTGTTNISTNNILNGTLTGTGTLTGIYNGAAPTTLNISTNTISTLTSASTATVIGIQHTANATTANINGNIINTLTSSGASCNISGINSSGGTTVNIYSNTINALSGSGATSPIVNGIQISGGTTTNVYINNIYNLSQSGAFATTAGAVNGMLISAGTTVYAYNNFISELKAPAANIVDAVRGISITSTTTSTTYGVYNNTVFLNASSSGTNFGSSGIYHTASLTATTSALDLRNNIIVNNSTPKGTGYTVAFKSGPGTAGYLANYASTSNNNNFYAGTPGTYNVIYFDGTSSAQTLFAYKTGVFTAGTIAPRDAASVTELPPFVNISSSPYDLRISTGSATFCEGRGSVVSTPIAITTDYYGTARYPNDGYPVNATYPPTLPDIGAHEFGGIPPSSLSGTVNVGSLQTYTSLTNAGGLFDAIYNKGFSGNLTVLITSDLTSETGSNELPQWTGSNTLTISPSGGAARTVSGTVNGALISLNGADNVTIDGLNTGGNSLTISNPNTGTSASTIKFINDATGNTVKNCTITGSSLNPTGGIIFFSTTTGTTGNSSNTINNNNITNAADANRPLNAIYSLGTIAKTNSGNTISNNNIYDFLNKGTASNGIQLAAYNTGWSITSNSFYETASFVPTAAVTYVPVNISAITSTDISISGNYIGGSAPSCGTTGSVTSWTKTNAFTNTFNAINLNVGPKVTTETSVQGNTIKNFTWGDAAVASAWTAINIPTTATGNINIGTVTGNTIGTTSGTGPIVITGGAASSLVYGIKCAGTTGINTISGNTIAGLNNATANSGTLAGLYYSGSTTAGSLVSGNFINGLTATGTGSTVNIYGIQIAAGATTYANNIISLGGNTLTIIYGIYETGIANHNNNLYFNTVYIGGTPASGTNKSYCLYSAVTTNSRNFRNNIFYNARSTTGGSSLHYGMYIVTSGGTFTCDYNDYYVSGTGGKLGFYATDKATLPIVSGVTGNDATSKNRVVYFVSATDLRLTGSSIGDLNLIATPISGITTDYFGNTRSLLYPYLGANENIDSPLPVTLSSFTSFVNNRDVKLNWVTASEVNNAGFFIEKSEFRNQNSEWKNVGFVAGKGTTNEQTSYTFSDTKLNSGKYQYRLKQIDNNGNFKYHNLNGVVEVGLPTKYEISQNYPNPFNPMTKIDFQLPTDGKVSLKIYDITGREMATLVNNEFKKADYYTVMFNGSSLSSGVYFYRITADKYVMTKKMVLLK
ncbi:MAG: T9SS type A sorting domain-containing protein [Ignavibacteriae bacterium]|nr:T9SS type A sorting domain-containing protein [Ignavibacteriota bacterium]